MQTKYLSENEQKSGQHRINIFQGLNGIGFNFMGETPVYLMAIHFGASNIELGYISSVIFLAGFILVFLPRLLAGKNIVNVLFGAWFIRGFFVLLFLLLFFLEERPAVSLILIAYTLFCSARMAGVVTWDPMVRMITTPQNRGSVLAKNNIFNQGGSLISKLASFLITSISFFSGIFGIILLQMIGVVFNTTASLQLKKIPCRETVEYRKGRSIFVIFIESMKQKERRFSLLLRWFSISLMIINGLIVVFIRKEAGFSSSFVFLYTMVVAAANISAGFFAKRYADKMGSRPLLIGMNLLLSLTFIIWMILPLKTLGELPDPVYFGLGFLTNFFLLSTNVLVSRIVVNTIPEKDTFSYNAMINFVTAVFSFFSGIVGGLLIDAGQFSLSFLPHSFSLLFLFAFALSLILIIFSSIIRDSGSLTIKETAAILFSREGFRAFNYISQLNTTSDPIIKKTVLLSISRNNTKIATEQIRKILKMPLSSERGEVLRSLFTNTREELLPEILDIAEDSESYHSNQAIFALGAYPGSRTEEVLINLLNSRSPLVRSNAAKSLGRIGHSASLDRICQLEKKAETTLEKMNFLIARKNMETDGRVFGEIFEQTRQFDKGLFAQSYYSLAAELLDFSPDLSEIYGDMNQNQQNLKKDFFRQCRNTDAFSRNYSRLITDYENGNMKEIWEFCSDSLQKYSAEPTTPEIKALADAVKRESKTRCLQEYRERKREADDVFAAIYFTYQILNSSLA